MYSTLQDIRHSARLLWKEKAFTFTVLITLAVCVGANSAIFSVVQTVLLSPLPFPDADQLVVINNSYPGAGVPRASNGATDYFVRRERLQSELEAELAVRADRHMLEQEMKQITTQWEEKGLPLFQTYFGALAKLMPQLPDMLRTAERLAAVDGAEIVLLLVGSGADEMERMEGEARLVVEDRQGVRIERAPVVRGADAAMAETLRKLKGGMVICQFGGLVLPDEGDLRPLAAALECPLFLVRADGPAAPPPLRALPGPRAE